MRVKHWRPDVHRAGVGKLTSEPALRAQQNVTSEGGWLGPTTVVCRERGRSQEYGDVSKGTV